MWLKKAPANTASHLTAGLFVTSTIPSRARQFTFRIIEHCLTVNSSVKIAVSKIFFISVMAESSTSAKRREGERGAMLNSPVAIAPHRTRENDPPPYGAQHRQDALWEGE